MEAYEGFAAVYDMFMEETDYDMWVEYIKKIWKKVENILGSQYLERQYGYFLWRLENNLP